MIEWQAESSLFTLRIRGRQWYWVYKYDFKAVTDLFTAPKNVGHNRWEVATPNSLQTSDDFFHTMQLRSHNKWVTRYWTEFLGKTVREDKFNVVAPQEPLFFENDTKVPTISDLDVVSLRNVSFWSFFNQKKIFFNEVDEDDLDLTTSANLSVFADDLLSVNSNISTNLLKFSDIRDHSFNSDFIYNHENFNDISRWTKKANGSVNPCRLIKYPVTNQLEAKDLNLLRLRFNDDSSELLSKPFSQNTHLVMKQKKYKPLKNLSARAHYLRDIKTGKNTKVAKYSGKMILDNNNNVFRETSENTSLYYKFFKKFKKQSESTPITLWKRLLRTKRTLVLPAHTNIAVITNSYDVIHSWFIPGLGLKMDCVPGRATHHVLNIDNVGFYYGQCAEICGRYHHHMPIRVCALPFEHFLVWWHTFGLNKLLFLGTDEKRFTKTYGLRKYVW